MEVIMVNGKAEIYPNAFDDWCHEHNPLRFFARLRQQGMEKKRAQKATDEYEKLFKLERSLRKP